MEKVKKRMPFLIVAMSVVILITFAFFGRVIPNFPELSQSSPTEYVTMTMSPDHYFRQSLNNCGPYSVMAVVEILSGKHLDPELLSREMTWRIIKNLTFPLGVLDLLEKHNVKTIERVVWNMSNSEKATWLRETVAMGHPVLILLEVKHVKHYFTVFGYDKKGFMIYDSIQEKSAVEPHRTVVDTKAIVGNRYYEDQELINLWNDGGFLCFFQNWAVECELANG